MEVFKCFAWRVVMFSCITVELYVDGRNPFKGKWIVVGIVIKRMAVELGKRFLKRTVDFVQLFKTGLA